MDFTNLAGRRRMIVGISGATGIVYGIRRLEVLRELDVYSAAEIEAMRHD
jgi:3-polyprenyl-4-hydroxybenzoate decarboxylase